MVSFQVMPVSEKQNQEAVERSLVAEIKAAYLDWYEVMVPRQLIASAVHAARKR